MSNILAEVEGIVECKPSMDTPIPKSAKVLTFFKHLFGWHNSCCMVAGSWNMEDHKQLRGPMCTRTRMPLLLPKNRKSRRSEARS